eukprot:91784-Chlamydomonas_euryale.AAC.1
MEQMHECMSGRLRAFRCAMAHVHATAIRNASLPASQPASRTASLHRLQCLVADPFHRLVFPQTKLSPSLSMS